MLGQIFDKILSEDEENKVVKIEKIKRKIPWVSIIAIFFIALIPRLLYIFVFSNPDFPGWYTDTFHHWQIAYLSKEVGFSQGFLRLWDFKGMEFFWGLLHPLVIAIIIGLTGSTSILGSRLLSTFGGAISIVLIFLIVLPCISFQLCPLVYNLFF